MQSSSNDTNTCMWVSEGGAEGGEGGEGRRANGEEQRRKEMTGGRKE